MCVFPYKPYFNRDWKFYPGNNEETLIQMIDKKDPGWEQSEADEEMVGL